MSGPAGKIIFGNVGDGLTQQIENDVLSLHESASALQSLMEHVLTAPIVQSSRDEAMTSVL